METPFPFHDGLIWTAADNKHLDNLLTYLREGRHLQPIEGTQSERDLDVPGQKSFDAVFRNHLLVRIICSFLSGNDLLNFRSVNHLFHKEAIPIMRLSRKPVVLPHMYSMDTFLTLMRTRLDPEKAGSIPFTAFQLNINQMSNEILERFADEIGQDVHRLSFGPSWYLAGGSDPLELKVIIILKHTVNISQIELVSCSPLWISDTEHESLPDSYPRLRVISLDHRYPPHRTHPPKNLLMNILISKAPNLHRGYVKALRIPDIPRTDNLALTILRNLTLQQTTPIANLDIKVRPHSLPLLQELQTVNSHIQHLYANLLLCNANRNMAEPNIHEIRNLLWNFSSWLTTLSPNICTLDLTLSMRWAEAPANIDLTIPQLEKLNHWIFHVIAAPEEEEDNIPTIISVPLARDQFPNLKHFSLNGSRNAIVHFQDSPQPSVQKFGIYSPRILESSPWHHIFPNLTTILFFSQSWMPQFEKNLIYVLKYFPCLTHLELNLRHVGGEPIDCWDILTGGAPRPLSPFEGQSQLHDVMSTELLEPFREPVDRIYQVPSLGNLQSLHTLICRPGRRSHMDAILYMTRIGHLVPLKKLVILAVVCDFDLKVDEKTAYRDLLIQSHTDVCITDWMDWSLSMGLEEDFPLFKKLLNEDQNEEDQDEVDDDDN